MATITAAPMTPARATRDGGSVTSMLAVISTDRTTQIARIRRSGNRGTRKTRAPSEYRSCIAVSTQNAMRVAVARPRARRRDVGTFQTAMKTMISPTTARAIPISRALIGPSMAAESTSRFSGRTWPAIHHRFHAPIEIEAKLPVWRDATVCR